ncbi:MAG: DegT/DnrJ/EryC1/StrS family aminotransferase [Myxococcales bacterium]|nr:MAG: DegT/DnrJ/EryC1/StrS family aminotransferase [Myxococcales bacterium]
MAVPFYRPSITEAEIAEVLDTLRSGWLTTGPKTKLFEERFAAYAGCKHAVAVNSCTAALHLALEAIGIARGDLVLVPAMTFTATAEVVRYFDAVPVLVDCEPETFCLDSAQARRILEDLRAGKPVAGVAKEAIRPPKAILPVHFGGQMADVDAIEALAKEFDLFVIDDAAHTPPAAFRSHAGAPWRKVGTTADITCFSFYPNKPITTGEGGMATTDNAAWADRMRVMSLHGISKDAWKRYSGAGSWYYEIVAPGFKYNLTDIAAALGVVQLSRVDELHAGRRRAVERYAEALAGEETVIPPSEHPDRLHAWHLYIIRLKLDKLRIDRGAFIAEMQRRGIVCSVHFIPLHLHPYWRETYHLAPEQFPEADRLYREIVTLPLFPGMTDAEIAEVTGAVREICEANRR